MTRTNLQFCHHQSLSHEAYGSAVYESMRGIISLLFVLSCLEIRGEIGDVKSSYKKIDMLKSCINGVGNFQKLKFCATKLSN